MRLSVLGCAGGSAPGLPLSCYLLDGTLAIDAGALTTALPLEQQRALSHLLLTHGHLDHVWTVPLLLANRFGPGAGTFTIHGSAFTLETLKKHLFNDRIWPDFTGARIDDQPLVHFQPMEAGSTRRLDSGHEVTAVGLEHVVPCQGYLVRRDGHSVLVLGDTTTTDEAWRLADRQPDLRAIVVECSFTDDLLDLARKSKHMTPRLLLADLAKLRTRTRVLVTHLKPGYEDGIEAALRAGGDPRIEFLRPGQSLDL
ncbi:MAG: MBL fold metallo-hydrolase [Planctomycetia bacterium]